MENILAGNAQVKAGWDLDSDNYYASAYCGGQTLGKIKSAPHSAFPAPVYDALARSFPDLHGVKACVPSSGDNIAVFALSLLGAAVTSCDISPRQLKNAKRIADSEGWDIEFKQEDSMLLTGIKDGAYDLVYTSNGVHTWIPDLPRMYRRFHSILKPGGKYLFFETHPFIRPFDDSTTTLRVKKRYDDTADNDWRLEDFLTSLLASGFTLRQFREFYAQKDTPGAEWWHKDRFDWDKMADWQKNPYAALPQWFCACAEK